MKLKQNKQFIIYKWNALKVHNCKVLHIQAKNFNPNKRTAGISGDWNHIIITVKYSIRNELHLKRIFMFRIAYANCHFIFGTEEEKF